MMLRPRLYYIFLIPFTIIPSILFSSYLQLSALAFHTASTSNVTIQTREAVPNNESIPFETVTAIYNHTNKALQALSEGNASEVENQLNFTKEKLSFVIPNNQSSQQSQESNITQTVARPEGTPNIDASSDASIDSSEDTAAVRTDTQNDNQGLSQSEIMERSEERGQVEP